jgi:acyl-CoA reductase-like NAD-dependent aldehyde dehydrogenase
VQITETRNLVRDIDHTLANFESWIGGKRVGVPLGLLPASEHVLPQPLGVVLIIAPWNYPIGLLLQPFAAALAAGNCAVLKPSELAPNVAQAFADLVPKYLDPDAVAVVTGGVETSTALLAEKYDHLFFTGGARVGRIVMEAAAKHLTPVTLELGGKSPCIVAADVDVNRAAQRIIWGRMLNAGQTCVAPDYVLVERAIHEPLVKALTATIEQFFGADPKTSPDFGRIVSEAHVDRLAGYLSGGRIAAGGQVDRAQRYVAPTVLVDVDLNAPVMREEIFGPILPVIPVDNIDAAISFVTQRDDPLALYLFSTDGSIHERVLRQTRSGGIFINDTIVQMSVPQLAFGGVGMSGFGRYHGEMGFETFSNMRGVLRRRLWPEPPLRYPPFSEKKLRWFDRLM